MAVRNALNNMDAVAQGGVGSQLSDSELARREALAKQAGYPSYEAMILFQRQRNRNSGNTTGGRRVPTDETNFDAPGRNNAMSWHPRTIFNHIKDALAGVNER